MFSKQTTKLFDWPSYHVERVTLWFEMECLWYSTVYERTCTLEYSLMLRRIYQWR